MMLRALAASLLISTLGGCSIENLPFYRPPAAGPAATLDVDVSNGAGTQYVDIGHYTGLLNIYRFRHLVALRQGAGAQARFAVPADRKLALRYTQSALKSSWDRLFDTLCFIQASFVAQPGEVLHLHAAITFKTARLGLFGRIVNLGRRYDHFYACHMSLYRVVTGMAGGRAILFRRDTGLQSADGSPDDLATLSDGDGDYDGDGPADHDDDDHR